MKGIYLPPQVCQFQTYFILTGLFNFILFGLLKNASFVKFGPTTVEWRHCLWCPQCVHEPSTFLIFLLLFVAHVAPSIYKTQKPFCFHIFIWHQSFQMVHLLPNLDKWLGNGGGLALEVVENVPKTFQKRSILLQAILLTANGPMLIFVFWPQSTWNILFSIRAPEFWKKCQKLQTSRQYLLSGTFTIKMGSIDVFWFQFGRLRS